MTTDFGAPQRPATPWKLVAITCMILLGVSTVFNLYGLVDRSREALTPRGYKDQIEAWQKATIAAQAGLAREVSNNVIKEVMLTDAQKKLLELQVNITILESQLAGANRTIDGLKATTAPATNPK